MATSYFQGAHNINITGGVFTELHGISAVETLGRYVSLSAIHDSTQRYPAPKCHPRTRIAVRDHVLQWITNIDNRPPILWLHGPAGAGKSSIAQTIAEHCSQHGQLAASFFFSRADPTRNTHHRLFSTIAYQLALRLSGVRSLIETIIDSDPSIPHKSMDIQLQKLILDPLESITHLLPVTIIIDGLDECEDIGVRHPFPLCILIASRPELSISEAFNECLQPTSTRLALDNSFHPDEDIRVFLEDGFNKIYNRHRKIMHSDRIHRPWPSADKIRLIVVRSSGQFIYAATLLKFIDNKYCRPSAQLEAALSDMAHPDAFSDIDRLYSQILEASNADLELLKNVLAGIFLLNVADQITTLEDLFQLGCGGVDLVLQGLHSLLRVPPHPPMVRQI